jgi:hypothetical protein
MFDGIIQDVTPLTITNAASGQHLIVLTKAGYEEARQTISLTENQKMPLDIKLSSVTGLVLIHSVPSDADVLINGAFRGRTPLLVTDLPLGQYRVHFASTGYTAKEMDLHIASRIPQILKAALTSDSAQLAIDSHPAGAVITINGMTLGITPNLFDRLPAGKKRVDLILKGYQPYFQEIQVEAGTSNAILAELAPIPAMLSVVSVPTRARIFLNDQLRGETPLELTNMPPGQWTVRAELKGYERLTNAVELIPGGFAALELTLTRNSGLLELVTEPANVQVFVDGEECGLTPAGDTELISNPLRLDMLSQGDHRLQLTRKGYFSLERQFTVEANTTVTLHEKLHKRFIADTRVRCHSDSGPEEVRIGAISQRFPNGDIQLETKPGIFITIPAGQIIATETIKDVKE